jgi:hypothetical protein
MPEDKTICPHCGDHRIRTFSRYWMFSFGFELQALIPYFAAISGLIPSIPFWWQSIQCIPEETGSTTGRDVRMRDPAESRTWTRIRGIWFLWPWSSRSVMGIPTAPLANVTETPSPY